MRHADVAVFVLALGLWGCGETARDPRTLAPLVSVVRVQSDGQDGQRFTGVVRARTESDLGFRVGGKVIARLVDAGQSVRKGQILMRLDPEDLALQDTAQAANVAAARARSLQADADLKRLQGLVEQGAISAQTLDAARAGADSARAQLNGAIAAGRAAANAHAYTSLIADADGVVELTLAEPGQVVAAGQPVLRLAHAGPREAEVDLPETLHPRIGATARAFIYGQSDAGQAATLRQLSQSADPATRTYAARYVLSGEGAAAPLGATVTVTMGVEGPMGGSIIPLGALYDPGGGPGVWLVEGRRVRFRPVRVAALNRESATISGLAAGARIVGLGAENLREGEVIRPAELVGDPAGRDYVK